METKLSTKGQVVLPQLIRKSMNLDVGIEGGQIVLVPRKKRAGKGRIIKDPLTGFPVLTAGKNAPVLTQKEVEEILAEFP